MVYSVYHFILYIYVAYVLMQITLKIVPAGLITNKSALPQAMISSLAGGKPLSEIMLTKKIDIWCKPYDSKMQKLINHPSAFIQTID